MYSYLLGFSISLKVLDKLDTKSLGAKIIKTVALIYIIEQFEKLPPIYDRIIDTFRDSVDNISDIEKTLEYLIYIVKQDEKRQK